MTDAVESGREPWLIDPGTRVTCPKCEHEFSLEEGFAKKSLEALEESSHGALSALQAQARSAEEKRARERIAQAEALLNEQLKDMRALLEAQRRQHAEALEQMRTAEKEAASARERALHEKLAARAVDLEGQLAAQSEQLAALQATELQLRRDRAELESKQQQLELDVQRRMDEERRQVAEAARAAEAEKSKLREADLQKKLDDTLAKLSDTQRQLEQGSQQAQGEVLELLLEEQLANAFRLDTITEVKKGARGGDAVHTVMTRSGQAAGVILWEAKRAQKWSHGWPAKLKEDMRAAGALAGVIVTTSFPSDWPESQAFGLHDDVWVTAPAAAIPMAAVLREGLIEAYKARLASANKGEKMEAVYDYLTSPQFAHKLRAVYEAFGKMRQELNVERTTMQQRWKRREKQIDLATVQLIGIAGDLQGLAQQDLPQLELEPAALESPGAGDETEDELDADAQ
ncbi:MAG: hypothetical protein QG550_955 [Pseudomonadota bacterium]|nr:hypothetical protein [Pseudomonadota bacterium]